MLILTRSEGRSVFIGDDIKITVLGIDRGQVRLGFEAPKSVTILREEVLERDNRALAEPLPVDENGEPNYNR